MNMERTSYPPSFQPALAKLGTTAPETRIRNPFGVFRLRYHGSEDANACLSYRRSWRHRDPIVRIHSACLLGESLHSLECDCRPQLDASLRLIGEQGGALIYLFQEGRGIGVCGKILAMELERVTGLDTVEAFRLLECDADPRVYDNAIQAMRDLALPHNIRLITNNPDKLSAVQLGGFNVVERLEPRLEVTSHTSGCMRKKEKALGHIPYSNIQIRNKN